MGSVTEEDVASLIAAARRRTSRVDPPGEGLRERKKRLTRQQISDTATAMFLDRGFDDVRVADVAEACGISEKTVYNYFPTKESLLLDREEPMAAEIRAALGPGAPLGSPIEAAVRIIVRDVEQMYALWAEHPGAQDFTVIHRFNDLIEGTPSLRAAQRDMMDRLSQVAAEAMAERAGVDPQDPEPQVAGDAILSLWRIEFSAMKRYADGTLTPQQAQAKVVDEVRRAARLIDTGLWSFAMAVQGSNGKEQVKAAAEASDAARKQVMSAIRQARDAWKAAAAQVQRDFHASDR
ncbi:MAG: TetR family transcriptional regulator [Frankiales bacterium]|nr:TetR family transcriptional regulator [Frankiales bacterium]